ncbi:unnamed protein product [Rotaria magnacalcarata]|uniref:G-patch domain-containing protein n=5 Tax=Rotaria magnacalcarata TaxID=392030 RepID=A0A815WHB3_9BILA|nr:unnamed protein product [Rotaria magnacalcarata]CAF1543499.1 unnamed protein product [Rotaria magnacalcarata]
MADGDFIEEFNITESDLDSAFNPTRRRGRQSKEEAIYGIWSTATERASNNATTTSSSYRRMPQGISFVSGGLKTGSKIEKKEKKKKKPILIESYDSDEDDSDEKPDDEYDDDDDIEIIKKNRNKRKESSDEDDDSDIQEIQDDSNPPAGSSDEEIEPPIVQRQPPNIQYQRPPPTNTVPVRDTQFGTFEKHTKGIGMKLLKKMGFKEGHGLGKNLQGRALPIQVVKREGKGAVGRYGNEDPNRVKPTAESQLNEKTRKSKKDTGPVAPQWRKQQRDKAPREHYVYKTLDDVLKDQTTKFQHKKAGGATREKIIDMTGREQRVLQNYDSIATKFDSEQVFSLEELTHNLDLVIESCEESMIRAHRRRKFDEDTTVALKYDMNHTEQVMSEEETNISRLNTLLNMINQCEVVVSQVINVSDLFFLQRIFDELRRNYEKEYKKYRLWDLAVPTLHSHLKQHLSSYWNIYNHDDELIELFSKWKGILEDDIIDLSIDHSNQSKETMDPYHRLIWDVWMPFLRKSILEWNPRQPDHLIDFIEQWAPYLPQWIFDNILDQLIFPVLNREVEAWNPLTDPIPIHSWIHPWLPLMKDRLEPLYQPIRAKLSHALQNWQPSDSSAKAVLLPWQKVFKQSTWDGFMNTYIVPKLVTTMQQFIIDPRQQVLDPWHWFISWYDVVPLASMIAILEKTFFPKWLQVLNVWLNTNPNYQEIQRWYSGWRSLLPLAIINHTVIKEKLTEGLVMIDRRISGSVNVQSTPQPPPLPNVNINYEAIYNRGVATTSSTVVSSFKDLVEKKASDHNLLFLPITNRTFEGKQVYQFGNANIYIDKNVIFVYENNQWIPLRLNDLIHRAV